MTETPDKTVPMRLGLGPTLRIAGPILEVICIVVLFRFRGRDSGIFGLSVDTFCFAGFAIGLLMVVAGILIQRMPAKPQDKWDLPRDPRD